MGTLTVQTLQAPTSGANANKVIIPSGHTLDASAGTIAPSVGQIVQVQRNEYSNNMGNSTSSSSIAVSGVYVDITPVYNDSLLVWDTAFYCQLNDTDGHLRYVLKDTNNSDTKLHSNTYCAASNYQLLTSTWENVSIRASGVSGTTSTMRLQLFFQIVAGATVDFGWSSGDQRVVTVMEIKQ